ncbi:MAG: hypothetical protein M3348_17725 [Acidobacteriota bacterium]|nr:hypothetical protein [Acidobacteriota bacterium]
MGGQRYALFTSPGGEGQRQGAGARVAALPFSLSPAQQEQLREALKPYNKLYDPAEKMVRTDFHTTNPNSPLNGTIGHTTVGSFRYAVALLETGEEDMRVRAIEILQRVIPLQDQNPRSKTYGTWPWFLEEPLDKMDPPDLNWADFCGTQLLQVSLYHRTRLPVAVAAQVDNAIMHAARSIQRRNVPPSYTNIALEGTYVTLVAGETYGDADLRDYALARLQRLYDYTKGQGAFSEYNSPTYTDISLLSLGRMRRHVHDVTARGEIDELYKMTWEDIALHFHPPTRQWAGPHSRSINSLLNPDVLALIQYGTEGRVNFGVDAPPLDQYRLPYIIPLPCPREFEPYFTTLEAARDYVKDVIRGGQLGAQSPLVATTHLEPVYALGTFNRSDLWGQRRALIAYWGDAQRPAYLHLRFLHDGHDFADAQFFSVQQRGDVLAAVNFATDGGETHPTNDRIKGGAISAHDLRLRFEFGGMAGDVEMPALPSTPSSPVKIDFGGLTLYLAAPYAAFGDSQPHWEASRGAGKSYLDLVLFQGAEHVIRLTELQRACVALAVRMSAAGADAPRAEASVRNGRLEAKWMNLTLSVPAQPGREEQVQNSFQTSR